MKLSVKLLLLAGLTILGSNSFGQSTVKLEIPDLNPSLDLTTGIIKGGGAINVTVTYKGSTSISNWALEMIWPSGAKGSVQGGVKTVLNDNKVRFTKPAWDNTGLVPGGTIALTSYPSWNDFAEFVPYDIHLLDLDKNIEIPLTLDDSGQGIYSHTPSARPMGRKKIVVYSPNFDVDNAKKSLSSYINFMDEVRFEWYSISADGLLQAAESVEANASGNLNFWKDDAAIALCKGSHVQVVPVINNYGVAVNDFDAARMSKMLNDPTLLNKHIADIVKLAVDNNYDGIDIDYENMNPSDKDKYSEFMEKLGMELHKAGKILTTAVYAKIGAGMWNGPQAQDLKRIGNAVDEMLLMTYDLHWSTGSAGILSAPDWANDCLYYTRSQVKNPGILQQGIPFYGYNWGGLPWGVGAPGVTYSDAQELIKKYNPAIQVDPNGGDSYFTYTDNATHTVYFQEKYGISKKLEALDKYNLGAEISGVGVWRLGSEAPELFQALCEKLHGDCFLGGISESPSANYFTIRNSKEGYTISNYPETTYDYVLYDISGRMILQEKNIQVNQLTIRMIGQKAGLYLFVLQSGNHVRRQKLMWND